MTNTEKLTNLLSACIRHSIPLDRARLTLDAWSERPRLTFDASKITTEELRSLKRCCEFEVQGNDASGYKALVGKTREEPTIDITVEKALTCKKVTIDDLSATEMDTVLERFKAGKAFVMDCSPTEPLEQEPIPSDIPF